MDVSQFEEEQIAVAVETSGASSSNVSPLLDGPKLLHTVVSLTGLPEQMMYEELDQILKLKDQGSEELTLDGLRAAMLAYLESIQADLESGAEGGADAAESDVT